MPWRATILVELFFALHHSPLLRTWRIGVLLIGVSCTSAHSWCEPPSNACDTERSFRFLWPGQPTRDARRNLSSPLVTNRPSFTEASSTVGCGVTQLELGYTYLREGANEPQSSAHVYPETLLRQGLYADWLEIQVAQTLVTHDIRGDRSTDLNNTYLG